MFDDLLNWLLIVFGPLGVALMFASVAFTPPKRDLKVELVFADPDGMRTTTVLLLALAIASAKASQVQGRRTGLSERAFPFGQTERRAKHTLDRPPP
ncbi:hypothetical protein [Pseudomonas citronellolis]|uniref:hypothetical protein n=1 Tax=Pseudomonas citronellolis TaxID=53408 RepID=UPI0022BA33E2|nr:hypothetical protein [Pseudomonas citronellolis]WBG63189.1 hypothetical protein ELR50_10045 [Pseudomonas citronellolis]